MFRPDFGGQIRRGEGRAGGEERRMRSGDWRRACRGALVGAGALFAASSAVAQSPRLHTNESVVEEASAPTTLAVSDPLAVFAFVFASLAERVKVYPTENYYYFSFVHAGVPYDGNIRLDASDRDQGKVHFAYAETMTDWGGETPLKYLLLDAAQGLAVEKLERLVYRLTFRGKGVIFALNDLSDVKPPALASDEKFVGPIFDESGIRFFLVFNAKLKIFHYVLDETVTVADEIVPARRTDRILIGKRTGFAFYRDHKLDRKILIGVFEGNSRLNTYFDGPFDQLPDNFIEGDTFRDMLLAVEPGLKGQIDRFGGSPDGSQRYMIAPYFYYARESDLTAFHTCATSKAVAPDAYYNCFVIDEASQRANRAVPLALKKARPAQRR
jgi:hypothetical protein